MTAPRRIHRLLALMVALAALVLSASVHAQSTTEPAQATAAAPPRHIASLIALLDQYKPDPAKALEASKVANAPPPASGTVEEMSAFHSKRAEARESLGMTALMLADRRRLVELNRGTAYEATMMNLLAVAESVAGNTLTALKLRETMLADRSIGPGPRRVALYQTAPFMAEMGDIARARQYIAEGDAIYDRSRSSYGWIQHAILFNSLREKAVAQTLRAEGKFEQAQQAFVQDIRYWEENLRTHSQRAANDPGTTPLEITLSGLNMTEMAMSQNLISLGRLSEAELAVYRVLMRTLSRSGKYTPATALAITSFANILNEQGRFTEAAALARIAQQVLDAMGATEQSRIRVLTRKVLADALGGTEDWASADAQYSALRKAVEADEYNRRIVRGSAQAGIAAIKAGSPQRALEWMKPLLDLNLKNLGANHHDTAEARGVYAMALAASGDPAGALQEFRESLRVLLAPQASNAQSEALAFRRLRLRHIIHAYLGLLWDIRDTPVERNAGLNAAAEAFRMADAVRPGSVQQALSASAARAAAGQAGLGDLIRKEQDERQEVQSLYETLVRLVSLPPEQQLTKVVADMRSRIADIEKNRPLRFAEIEKRFPAYASLITPRPATVAEAAKALRADEVLISILSTPERSFVWTITPRGAVTFHASALGEAQIGAIVSSLRASLDPGPVPLDKLPPFNLNGAHQLYAELFAPSRAEWGEASTLVVSSSGALSQIPLAVLPTSLAPLVRDSKHLLAEFKGVAWLANAFAVVNIPSVTALVRLRALPATTENRRAFVGFGDPQFALDTVRSPQPGASTRGVPSLRDLRIARMDNATTTRALTREGDTPLDWTAYKRLPALPDTREEILSIAQALGADPARDVYLGPDASKRMVRSLDLSDQRVVAFATHGLVAGDLPGLTQPALALAALDDALESPLLTLEDVLSLKLNADLVVLSACNTAAADGEGAEAISGLGRGFFYAGSRSLLVTHWPVETVSARLLTTGLFERYRQDPRMTRAQALRQSMLAVMQDNDREPDGKVNYSYAHPMFWAPYALIGDGGR